MERTLPHQTSLEHGLEPTGARFRAPVGSSMTRTYHFEICCQLVFEFCQTLAKEAVVKNVMDVDVRIRDSVHNGRSNS